jgi:transcriptional regulator with XRE-family HTH domain
MAHKLTAMRAQRLAAGFTISDLAKRAGVGDRAIVIAEDGGAIHVNESQRIADALGVSLATLGKQDHNG